MPPSVFLRLCEYVCVRGRCVVRHSANWYRAHDHMLNAFRGICQEAGHVTDVKQVMTSEGARRADIAIFGIGVLQHTDLLADVAVRHDFHWRWS